MIFLIFSDAFLFVLAVVNVLRLWSYPMVLNFILLNAVDIEILCADDSIEMINIVERILDRVYKCNLNRISFDKKKSIS